MDRLLVTIRNVAGRATRKKVLEAEPLKLKVWSECAELFRKSLVVEDLSKPAYMNSYTTIDYGERLPAILAGKDEQWQLWEVQIYESKIVLGFANHLLPVTAKVANTLLTCTAAWPSVLALRILLPEGSEPAYYRVDHVAPDDQHRTLVIRHPQDGLLKTETHDLKPLPPEMRELRPLWPELAAQE